MMKLRLVAASLMALSVTACVTTKGEKVTYYDPFAKTNEVASIEIFKPEKGDRFPAVLLLHSCAGVNDHTREAAALIQSWGYVAVIVDSYSPRGLGDICTGQQHLIAYATRVYDAYAALKHVRTLPYVDGSRTAAIGYSMGANVSVLLGEPRSHQDMKTEPFSALIALYPPCNALDDSYITRPTLIFVGGRDDWTPSGGCEQLGKKIADPKRLEVVLYPNATHAWDTRSVRSRVVRVGNQTRMVTMQYDPAATADSHRRIREFLAAHLTGG